MFGGEGLQSWAVMGIVHSRLGGVGAMPRHPNRGNPVLPQQHM